MNNNFIDYYYQNSGVDKITDDCLADNINVISECFTNNLNNEIRKNEKKVISVKKYLIAPIIMFVIMSAILSAVIGILGMNDNYKYYYIGGGVVGLVVVVYSYFASIYYQRSFIKQFVGTITLQKMSYIAKYEKERDRIIIKSIKEGYITYKRKGNKVVEKSLSVANFFAKISFRIPVIVLYILLLLSPIAFVVWAHNWGKPNGLGSVFDIICYLIVGFVLAIVIAIITKVIGFTSFDQAFELSYSYYEERFVTVRLFANIIGIIAFWIIMNIILDNIQKGDYGVLLESVAAIIYILVGGVIALIAAICLNLFIRLLHLIIAAVGK